MSISVVNKKSVLTLGFRAIALPPSYCPEANKKACLPNQRFFAGSENKLVNLILLVSRREFYSLRRDKGVYLMLTTPMGKNIKRRLCKRPLFLRLNSAAHT
jgi:hypothetical protein